MATSLHWHDINYHISFVGVAKTKSAFSAHGAYFGFARMFLFSNSHAMPTDVRSTTMRISSHIVIRDMRYSLPQHINVSKSLWFLVIYFYALSLSEFRECHTSAYRIVSLAFVRWQHIPYTNAASLPDTATAANCAISVKTLVEKNITSPLIECVNNIKWVWPSVIPQSEDGPRIVAVLVPSANVAAAGIEHRSSE